MLLRTGKKIQLSSNHPLICATDKKRKKQQQQPFGSFVTSFGIRKSVRVATKNNRRLMREIKICNDVWMDILPRFNRVQLGFKLALLSHRHNSLVDKHFMRAKFILNEITILRSSNSTEPEVRVYEFDHGKLEWKDYPLPMRPLRNIRIRKMFIRYIDHSVIKFLRSINFDNNVSLSLDLQLLDNKNKKLILDAVQEILPIFATNLRRLMLQDCALLNSLRRRISPTFLNDFPNLKMMIVSGSTLPKPKGLIAEQTLFNWLHTPTTDGQPKEFLCYETNKIFVVNWADTFKETFRDATTCASYNITIINYKYNVTHHFECVNERTQEKLTMNYANGRWSMKRCPIAEPLKQEEKVGKSPLNQVIVLLTTESCIGSLTPPTDEQAKNASK